MRPANAGAGTVNSDMAAKRPSAWGNACKAVGGRIGVKSMANFLIIVDPDADRRSRFIKAAQPRLAFLDGLVSGQCVSGDFAALWAAGRRAPIVQMGDDDRATIIWGAPIDVDGHAIAPAALAAGWREDVPQTYDGYFAAVDYDRCEGVAIGADILGLYPLFWWQSGDVLLAASSPELFRHHPLFRIELDLAGLTGILLLMHSVSGRSLMKGVRRLAPGHVLRWRPGVAAKEILHYRIPVSTDYFDLPFSAVVELINDTLRRAVARHVPKDAPVGLTLSGGRDSRLLAGLMVDLGRNPVALTFGEPDDFEMQCAAGVARALGLTHLTHRMRPEGYAAWAELHAQWLHCVTGFNCIEYWNCLPGLARLPPLHAAAHSMDYLPGGFAAEDHNLSFANWLARNNAWGIPLGELRGLLKPGLFGSLVDDAISELKAAFDSYGGLEGQRAMCFELHNRLRFHNANLMWQFCFESWPVMPAVDQDLLRIGIGIPLGVLSERRVEDEMICRYFPHLAELPVDRNSTDTRPLRPRLRYQLAEALRTRAAPVTRFLPRGGEAHERRVYYRVFDFNGPGWQDARHAAEPHRKLLYEFFDRTALDRYLPPAGEAMHVKNGISDYSGRKLLLGLALWVAKNL